MFINSLISFLVGGAICAICEVLLALTKLTPARILVGLVTAGISLGAVGAYEPLLSFASTGVSVPLLGFGGVAAAKQRFDAQHLHAAYAPVLIRLRVDSGQRFLITLALAKHGDGFKRQIALT